jgi:hypothetical protein
MAATQLASLKSCRLQLDFTLIHACFLQAYWLHGRGYEIPLHKWKAGLVEPRLLLWRQKNNQWV